MSVILLILCVVFAVAVILFSMADERINRARAIERRRQNDWLRRHAPPGWGPIDD